MHEHALFAGNVLAHLVASMSGLVSFVLSVVQAIRKKEIATWIFFGIGCLCLLVAFDQAWRDEHRNVEAVTQSKADAWGQFNTCDKERAVNNVLVGTYESQIAQQRVSLDHQQDVFNRCVLTLQQVSIPERQRTHITQIQPITEGNVNGKILKVWFLLVFTNRPATPARGKANLHRQIHGSGL